jgi:hypothetical protein
MANDTGEATPGDLAGRLRAPRKQKPIKERRVQRCALCGALYPLFKEGENKVTCKKCGVEWLLS